MAQNINFKGEWLNVPGVNLPKNGGGTAYFADASVITAARSDVAQGKIFLDATGQPQTGTNQGGGGSPTLQTVTKSYTPTESQQTETITPGSGYDGIGEVDVAVGAISPTYVGSGIARRSSCDLTESNLTVTAPILRAGSHEAGHRPDGIGDDTCDDDHSEPDDQRRPGHGRNHGRGQRFPEHHPDRLGWLRLRRNSGNGFSQRISDEPDDCHPGF